MNVILEAVVGSTAYGLATEDSDIDTLGVFAAPTSDVLGLEWNSKKETHVKKAPDPDSTHHEVAKYLRLLIGGNPTITELLFAEPYTQCTDLGLMLVVNGRRLLTTKRVRDSYAGYALQQAKRNQRRHEEGKKGFSSDTAKRSSKHGRHCYRLILQGKELLETGQITLDVSDRRQPLFAMGELAASDPDEFLRMVEDDVARLDAVPSVLPDEVDMELANTVLLKIRRTLLAEEV